MENCTAGHCWSLGLLLSTNLAAAGGVVGGWARYPWRNSGECASDKLEGVGGCGGCFGGDKVGSDTLVRSQPLDVLQDDHTTVAGNHSRVVLQRRQAAIPKGEFGTQLVLAWWECRLPFPIASTPSSPLRGRCGS